MSCLEPAEVVEFAAGRGDDAARLVVEEHIDECADCRRLVAAAAAADATAATGGADIDGLLRGTALGRYVLRDRLGAGGMGVVYLADDGQLGRAVVIKLIRADLDEPGASEAGSARMLREAKAMARVSHPNVVPIYDIGTYDASLYVAMEYLDGGDLLGWLRQRARAPGEIIDVFVHAARGLAAAHAAGLVHRDFKPANVVMGAGGAVKVTDFGLARGAAGESIEVPGGGGLTGSGAVRAMATSLTRTGVAVGTPAYMSPEQAAGRTVDARSDQYSFCIALREALRGKRIPARVHEAIERGLRIDASARFPSMDELIAELAPRRRLVPLALAGAAVVALVSGGVLLAGRGGDAGGGAAADPCGAADAELRPLLETARRREDMVPFTGRIDMMASAWRDEVRAACEATRLRGEQPEALMQRRLACLERRRGELVATVEYMASVSEDDLGDPPGPLARLEPLRTCADERALATEPLPAPPGREGDVAALRHRITHGEQWLAEDPDELAEIVDDARTIEAAASSLGHAPTLAEAHVHRGNILRRAGDPAAARVAFEAAVRAALEGNALRTRAIAYARLVELARAQGQEADATEWRSAALRVLARLTPIGLAPDGVDLGQSAPGR
ncbi:MAG TPA: serine/threonine-protein kinase [Kofleriaceae bacterium]|nr:serine/threonine-protein kinase [Kofleriaceae bacterium]